MNAKKVVGFLLCKSAFTRRNISSIMLVAVFFVVYLMAGGRVSTSLPDLKNATGLGSSGAANGAGTLINENNRAPVLSEDESKAVLGITPSKERMQREDVQTNRYKLFANEDTAEMEKNPVDPDGLVKGQPVGPKRRDQLMMERNEKKQVDSLAEIEQRLKKKSAFSY
jgi:hypothetical protein